MTYARAFSRSSSQPISNNVITKLLIDSASGDKDGFFSQSNLGFVIPSGRGGLYVVMVTGYWDASPAGGMTVRQVEIRSGNAPIGADTKLALAGMATWISAIGSAVFNAGDVITVHAMQNSGATLHFRQAVALIYQP